MTDMTATYQLQWNKTWHSVCHFHHRLIAVEERFNNNDLITIVDMTHYGRVEGFIGSRCDQYFVQRIYLMPNQSTIEFRKCLHKPHMTLE